MSKTPTDIRSLARGHTEKALNVLVGIMHQEEAPHASRVSAANSLLDRGWGKAAQAITNGDDGPFEVIQRIERVIVNAPNTDG